MPYISFSQIFRFVLARKLPDGQIQVSIKVQVTSHFASGMDSKIITCMRNTFDLDLSWFVVQ